MINPEQLLREGEARRAKQARLRKALAVLKKSTERNVLVGYLSLLLLAFFAWMKLHGYMSSEPMTKSNGLNLILDAAFLGMALKGALSMIIIDPKDLALRDLIEEKIEKDGA